MNRSSHKDAISAFAFGLLLFAPAAARSGGDLCAPFQQSTGDVLKLELTATTVDGIAQPLGAHADPLSIFSWHRDASSDAVDDLHAGGGLPDPHQPSKTILVYLTRQP